MGVRFVMGFCYCLDDVISTDCNLIQCVFVGIMVDFVLHREFPSMVEFILYNEPSFRGDFTLVVWSWIWAFWAPLLGVFFWLLYIGVSATAWGVCVYCYNGHFSLWCGAWL
jgi:hypothetical protein